MTMWEQDGVLYNPSTKKPIDPSELPKMGKKPPIPSKSLKCNICGAIRQSAEEFKEHLMAAHPEKVPELMPTPKQEGKSKPSAEKSAPSVPAQMTTENIVQPQPPLRGKVRGRPKKNK